MMSTRVSHWPFAYNTQRNILHLAPATHQPAGSMTVPPASVTIRAPAATGHAGHGEVAEPAYAAFMRDTLRDWPNTCVFGWNSTTRLHVSWSIHAGFSLDATPHAPCLGPTLPKYSLPNFAPMPCMSHACATHAPCFSFLPFVAHAPFLPLMHSPSQHPPKPTS